MEFLIITSTEDKASMNIRNNLLNSNFFSFKKSEKVWFEHPIYQFEGLIENDKRNTFLNNNQIYLGLTDEPLIFLNNLKLPNSNINPDAVIFASRHTSKTARPAILIHTTGNWTNEIKFGAGPSQLSKTSALLQKAGFYCLKNGLKMKNLSKFRLDIEVTHHGPTKLEIPLVYMELGSSKHEWSIKEAGEMVGNAIINTIFTYISYEKREDIKIALGFGGTHYAPNFNKVMIHPEIALSFICPKYYIQGLNKMLITQMIENTVEAINYFIIDWKGTNSEDKKHLMPLLEDYNIPIKKTKDF